MHVRTQKIASISDIIIPDKNTTEHAIVFKFSSGTNKKNARQRMYDIGLGKLGEFSLDESDIDDPRLLLTVRKATKVHRAIQVFINSKLYSENENKHLFEQLNDYLQSLTTVLENSQQKPLPLLHKKYSSLQSIDKTNVSANQTSIACCSYHPEKTYIHKLYSSKRSISVIEPFNAICYQLLLGHERHPDVRAVFDENNQRYGVVSKKLEGFQSFHDRFLKNGEIPRQVDLLQYQAVHILVAAYTEKENDLHGGNWGDVPDGNGGRRYIKIDDDQSTYSLTSRYLGIGPQSTLFRKVAAANAFPVTANDIREFPILSDASPRCSPDRSDSGLINFNNIKNNEQFIKDKFYMFLKRIVIPDDVYYNSAAATIPSLSKRNAYANDKCERTRELHNVLVNMPEFQNYLINHQDVIEQIIDEFKTYNQHYPKQKHASLRVDLDQVKMNFNLVNCLVHANAGVKQPGFFERHPAAYLLIGFLLGCTAIAIIAGLAVSGILPGVIAGGVAIGTAMGLTGSAALGVGLASIAAVFLSTCAALAKWIGDEINQVSRKARIKNRAPVRNNLPELQPPVQPLEPKQPVKNSVSEKYNAPSSSAAIYDSPDSSQDSSSSSFSRQGSHQNKFFTTQSCPESSSKRIDESSSFGLSAVSRHTSMT
jgi:hypothetical protein